MNCAMQKLPKPERFFKFLLFFYCFSVKILRFFLFLTRFL